MNLTLETSVPTITVFIQGLLSFFSPCILPLIPIYMSYLAGGMKSVDKDGNISYPKKEVMIHTSFFVIGISFAFVLLGLGFTAMGQFFNDNRMLLARVSGIIMIFLGLYQGGFLGHSMVMEKERRISYNVHKKKMNPLSAFILGFTFSFAWTPCVGPTLGSVLLMATSSASSTSGFMLIGVFTVGFILPFLAVGLFTTEVLNFFKTHQQIVRYTVKAGAVLLVFMGIMTATGFTNDVTSYLATFDSLDATAVSANETTEDDNGNNDSNDDDVLSPLSDDEEEVEEDTETEDLIEDTDEVDEELEETDETDETLEDEESEDEESDETLEDEVETAEVVEDEVEEVETPEKVEEEVKTPEPVEEEKVEEEVKAPEPVEEEKVEEEVKAPEPVVEEKVEEKIEEVVEEPVEEDIADDLTPAFDFKLTDQFGNVHSLADYKGKTIFMNFWGTWCPPCKEEMPDIQALYEEYGYNKEDVIILGVAFPNLSREGSVADITAFLSENGYTFPVLMDTSYDLFNNYNITAFPTTFMITSTGGIYGYVTSMLAKDTMIDIIEQTVNFRNN